MATGPDLKAIAQSRLNTAKMLMETEDWHGASYMLPHALECALKAAICKTLHLGVYPDNEKSTAIRTFFATHYFVQLLVASGLQDIISPTGAKKVDQNWADFTLVFAGNWPEMEDTKKNMNEILVLRN